MNHHHWFQSIMWCEFSLLFIFKTVFAKTVGNLHQLLEVGWKLPAKFIEAQSVKISAFKINRIYLYKIFVNWCTITRIIVVAKWANWHIYVICKIVLSSSYFWTWLMIVGELQKASGKLANIELKWPQRSHYWIAAEY